MAVKKLTDAQKRRLSNLEPRLRNAVRYKDYDLAKTIAYDIQSLLRESGHETRLAQSKNWLCEAAIEAGEYNFAEGSLKGIRSKMNLNTRVYLEATSLLVICYLRQGKTELAEPYMEEVLRNDKVIRSELKRTEFRQHIIKRFEEEGVLNALSKSKLYEHLDPKEIQDQAGILVQANTSDEELFRKIGVSCPPEVSTIILRVDEISRKCLPMNEIKLLPSPEDKQNQEKVGVTVAEALKRRLYAALCDKDSDIYKAWVNNGLGLVLNKLYLGTAIGLILKDVAYASMALAVSLAAIVFKLGVETWCEVNKPSSIMLR